MMTLPLSFTVLLFLVILLTLAVSLAAVSALAVVCGWLTGKQSSLTISTKLGLNIERLIRQLLRHSARDNLHKWYTWEFPTRPSLARRSCGSRFFTELLVNKSRYTQYHQRPRELDPNHFDVYVTVSIPEIESLTDQLLKLGQAQGFNTYDQLCNTLAFVQQGIRYTADLSPQTGQLVEYPKYPLETLVDKKGDCEDQAILAAALLTRMGYKVALLILPPHVALGIADFNDKPGCRVTHPATGSHYLYTETTAPNWLPGEVPREFQPYLASGQFEILPMVMREPH